MASKKGDKEVVERLLSAGADVNHQDEVWKIYDCCDESYFISFCNYVVLTLMFWFCFLSNSMERLPSKPLQ